MREGCSKLARLLQLGLAQTRRLRRWAGAQLQGSGRGGPAAQPLAIAYLLQLL